MTSSMKDFSSSGKVVGLSAQEDDTMFSGEGPGRRQRRQGEASLSSHSVVLSLGDEVPGPEENTMAILRQDDTREDLRRKIIEEAEERRRRHPVPPMEEVLEESRRLRESLPRDLNLPDSTTILREDRER